MNVEFIEKLIITSIPFVLGHIVWLLQKQKVSSNANSEGTKCLLRVKLIEYHDDYMKKGCIPSYAYLNFCEMYDAYHALGGNGMVTKMFDEIKTLEIGKEKTEE